MRFSCFAKLLPFQVGPRLFQVLSPRLPKMFPCDECDNLLSSKGAFNDHKRKKHNSQENVSAKIFKCGHCEISFTKSCILLRHLKSQHESGSSYRCFSCPTYFGQFKAMTDHQEQYQNDLSSSTAIVDFSDLLDFTTEAVNSKFGIHRLKLDDSGLWSRSTTLFSCGKKIISFVNALLRETSNLKHRMSIAVRLESLWKVKALKLSSILQCVDLPVSSLKTHISNTLTH